MLPDQLTGGDLRTIGCDGFLSVDGLQRMLSTFSLQLRPAAAFILEVGPGNSRLGEYLGSRLGCQVCTVDKRVCSKPSASASDRWPIAERMLADVHDLPLRSACVTGVVANDVLHLSPRPAEALSELRRVLKPGGLLFFTTYTAKGAIPGGSTLHPDWRPMVEESGLSLLTVSNVSGEWRSIMRDKHWRRIEAAEALLSQFREAARAELSVSEAMVGHQGPAFLDLVERWEIAATA